MKAKLAYLALIFSLLLYRSVNSQIMPDTLTSNTVLSDTVKLYLIETSDGNEYIGEIVYEDKEAVPLKTETMDYLFQYQKILALLSPSPGSG